VAEYSTVDLEEATDLGRRVGVHVSGIRPLTGGMRNSSFVLETDAGRLVLSVLDSHDVDSAAALADLTVALAAGGVPTPAPLASPGGGHVLRRADGTPVAIRPHVDGTLSSPVPERDLHAIGTLLGRVHTLDPPIRLPPPTRRLPGRWRHRVRGRADPRLVDLLERAVALDREIAWSHLPQGLTHGDLFDDNLIHDDAGWHVIDWEYAAHDVFVLDIAIAIIGVCRAGGPTLDPARVRRFLDGYEAVRPLEAVERVTVRPALRYGAAVLAYERWVRHNLDWPDPARATSHVEMVDLADALAAPAASGHDHGG
jgi:homoserine kinase type II